MLPFRHIFTKIAKKFHYCIIIIVQICVFSCLRLYVRHSKLFSFHGTRFYKKDERYFFVANHQSILDSFIIFADLPLLSALKIVPVRYLTAKPIYYSPGRFLLWCLGSYPTQRKDITVHKSAEFVLQGNSVFFFPEGRRTLRQDSAPKDGALRVIELLKDQPNVNIVLCHLEWSGDTRFKKRFEVRFKKIPITTQFSSPVELMNAIYSV